MKNIVFIFFLLLTFIGHSQDSLQQMSYASFIDQVMKHHPMVYRADIKFEQGQVGIKAARGAFDPKLFGDINQKYFKDQQYYSTLKSGIKIPTWFGLSAEAGYEQNGGEYLNPQYRLPDAGLWYAGLRLELGNGLIIDQRRAALQQAKVYASISELEQRMMRNELKFQASIAYWNWVQHYRETQVYQTAVDNAKERFEAVKSAAQFGDRPYIDTVEAYASVQNRILSFKKSSVNLANAELDLELFLWSEGLVPLEIENVIPDEPLSEPSAFIAVEVADSLIQQHPYVQMNTFKIRDKEIEARLKREQLKPDLTLKYNAISEPVGNNPFVKYSSSNYTWGASLSYPIFTRKERGGLNLAKLKIEDQKLATDYITAEVENEIRTTINKLNLAVEQVSINTSITENYQTLYGAEQKLFLLGESSVFLINSRENSLLKAQIALIQQETGLQQLQHTLDYKLMLE